MEIKIAIIGAGISGISVAKMLADEGIHTTIFEQQEKKGGMLKCRKVHGNLFHQTGGHVFNTKNEKVATWFWSHFDQAKEFTKALRNSSILFAHNCVSYPIENHIYQLDIAQQKAIIQDLLQMAREEKVAPQNFEEFLRSQFGETLYQLYFRPYNQKIWRKDLRSIPLDWLEGKLPMPTLEEILLNNFNHIKEQQFVHSSFYYPVQNGSQFIIDRISQKLDIRCNQPITSLQKSNKGWFVNGEEFHYVIFTGNVKQMPTLLADSEKAEQIAALTEPLEAHGTTAVFCEIEKNPYSWIYLPEDAYSSHRIICTGNFSPHNNAEEVLTATVEFTDYISKEDILDHLQRMPLAPRYLDHHYEAYTYPVQNGHTRQTIDSLKQQLEPEGIYLLGRFAEWEYYNMDVAMAAAMKVKEQILMQAAQ